MLNTPDDVSFLEKLYAENYALVYKLVTRTLRQHAASTADAADITQDVFILAAKRIDVLRSHPKPVGWLLKTTQYVCRNHISAYRRHASSFSARSICIAAAMTTSPNSTRASPSSSFSRQKTTPS